MRKFEAHITCPRDYSERVEQAFSDEQWKFSAIDGDPVMGKQAYCCLTAYDTDGNYLKQRVLRMGRLLRTAGIPVLREKIEEIIFDTKTEYDVVNMCCGHCGEP